MFTRFVGYSLSSMITLSLVMLSGGCSEEVSSNKPAPDAVKKVKADTESPAGILAKLAKADQLDGKTDKIVVRCASCALSMDGNAEHSLAAHGYTFYFCQAGCAERFGKDIEASIGAMEIPE